jgi:AcrR family transcriptional regulator
MTAALALDQSAVDRRLAAVPRPVAVMSRERSAALTTRQRELLDELAELIADGFSHLTMADLAAELGCSLRTLYGIASSRDGLVLVACDRKLWETGRRARTAVVGAGGGPRPLDSVRRYLHAASRAVNATTVTFATDLAAVPGGADLSRAHSDYLVAMTKELLDLAAECGEIRPVDTIVIAQAMAGISNAFIHPDVIETLPGTPKEASDHVVDIILRGLAAPTN